VLRCHLLTASTVKRRYFARTCVHGAAAAPPQLPRDACSDAPFS